MGYKTKIQLIKRQKGSDQYYVNFPGVLAEVLGVEKGEEVAWGIAEGGELVLDRLNKKRLESCAAIFKLPMLPANLSSLLLTILC